MSARAGSFSLSLLATPGIAPLLKVLDEGSLPLAELRRVLDSPPQTTLRAHLRELTELGILEHRREAAFPRTVDYSLAQPGRELLHVADALEGWLGASPRSRISLGEIAAKHMIKALADGWSTGIIAKVVAEPLSLTQLGQAVSDLSYPSVERRISAMRASGLIETGQSNGHGAPCIPTAWLRHAAAPIAAASRFERRHIDSMQDARVDVSTLLMLAMPIVRPPHGASGTAMLAAGEPKAQVIGEGTAGIVVEIRDGLLQSCGFGPMDGASSWALGPPDSWLEAAVDGAFDQLLFGGVEPKLARDLARSFYEALQIRKSIR